MRSRAPPGTAATNCAARRRTRPSACRAAIPSPGVWWMTGWPPADGSAAEDHVGADCDRRNIGRDQRRHHKLEAAVVVGIDADFRVAAVCRNVDTAGAILGDDVERVQQEVQVDLILAAGGVAVEA